MLFEFKILKYTHMFTVFYAAMRLYFICVSVTELDCSKKKIKIFPCGGIPKLKYMYSVFTIANASALSVLQVVPYGDASVLDASGLWIHGIDMLASVEIGSVGSVKSGEVVYERMLSSGYEDLISFISEKGCN